MGACGVEGGRKGSRGQSQSRVVSGQRFWQPGFRGARFPIAGRTPPPAGNARAAVDAGSLTSFFFVPFLATVSNFSTAGSGVTGGCRSARVWARSARAGGARVRSIPRHLVFRRSCKSAPANEQSGGFRAVDSLSIRAFVAASMSPPYFLSMATTSSSPWPVIEQSVRISCFAICVCVFLSRAIGLSTPFASRLFHGSLNPERVYPRASALRSECARRMPARALTRTAAGSVPFAGGRWSVFIEVVRTRARCRLSEVNPI